MSEAAALIEESRPRYLLGRMLAVLAIAATMIGSSAPSPIYGLYQERLHFAHTVMTGIYGAYSIGTVVALFALGQVSDRIGDRRLLIFASLLSVLAGAVVMAFAESVPMLLVGRFLAGVGTGCVMGPATAALVELDPARDRIRAGVVATVAVTVGIIIGVVVTGIALEWQVSPTVTPFVVLATIAALLFIGLRLVPWAPVEPAVAPAHPHHAARPGSGALIREAGWPFVIACGGMIMVWMVGGSFLALGAIFAHRLAGIDNPALAGLTIAVFQIVAGCVQLGGRKVSPPRMVIAGALLMASGLLVATLAAAMASAALFCLGALLTGAGYGSCFTGAAAIGSRSAPAHGRATIVSFTYVTGYIGNVSSVLALGVIADHFGLFTAMASLAVAAVIVGVLLLLGIRRVSPAALMGL